MKRETTMTPQELSEFDEASSHPYECKCDLCKKWWASVPPEDDDSDNEVVHNNGQFGMGA